MSLTPADVHEAADLIRSHNSLRWNIARSANKRLGLYLVEDEERTSQPHLPPQIGRQILTVALALVESRLRDLGVEPEQGLTRDCFECRDGKVPME
jgi:hypothetical protein